MWDLTGKVDLDRINKLLDDNPRITFDQFMSLLPHLRINYADRRFQTMLMTEWAVISLTEDDKKILLQTVLSSEQWTEFTYVTFKVLIKVYRNPKFAEDEMKTFIIRRLFIALSSKELVKIAQELFITYTSKYTLIQSDFIENMKIALEVPANTTTLIHSLSTQMIAVACKVWGNTFLRELQSNIPEEYLAIHLTVKKFLLDIKESGITMKSFVPHMKTTDQTCQEIIFTTLCKIKKTNYFYNMFDIEFVISYIQMGDPSVVIDYMPYFCSHIYYSANTKQEKLGSCCVRVVGILRKIALRLLSGKRGEERIEVGGFLYHLLCEIILKNNVKTAYAYKPDYDVKCSPLCTALASQKMLHIGSKSDIMYFAHKLLDMENVVPVLRILSDLDDTENLVGKDYFIVFLFANFTDPKLIFIQEKVDVFVEFLLRVYHKTEEMKLEFFVKWLMFWKEHCLGRRGKLHMNVYLSLRAILDGIKRHHLQFETEYCRFEDLNENIDSMIAMLNSETADQDEIRTFELVLTTSADLLIHQGRLKMNEGTATIRNILSKLEAIINCNIRYVTATVTAHYRKFVSMVSPLYIDFFREYVLEKVASINPEISKQSKMRRGAEHRAIIHSICAEVPKKYKESFIRTSLNSMMHLLVMPGTAPEIISSTFHCLNQIMEDRSLKEYSSAHIFDLLHFCLDLGNSNQHFSVSNARYLLFRTITFRILPSVDRRKNLQLNDVFRMYPKLLETTLEMGDSDNFDQNTKILLISFLKSASEMNMLPSPSDYQYNILPTCAKMLNRQFNHASYLVLDLFVSVIPIHNVFDCFLIINSFLLSEQDISLQVFYNHLYILNELSDKLLLHIETDYCNKCYINWQKMQESMLDLKLHKKFIVLLKTGLIVDFENLQNTAVNVNFDYIPKCLTVLIMNIEKMDLSDSIKVMAANILLSRTDETHPCYEEVLIIAIKIALMTKSVGYAKNLITELVHVLSSCGKTDFPIQIHELLLVPCETLLEKRKQCIKYIFLYTYLLSCFQEMKISNEIERLILKSFYCIEDEEAVTVFPRLHLITKNRVEILLIGLFISTLSDYEDNYICQTIFNHFNILTLSFNEGITTLLSLPFLKNYLHCPKAVQSFIIKAVSLLNSLNTNDILAHKQFIYVTSFFQSLLFLFID